YWDTSLGKGRPGWHIECSAMSVKYLGQPFDIHTGGVDHIPVHHTNEIAQSESAFGKPFVKFWMHNAFVNVGGGKMAKSEGNFITLKNLEERGFNPLALRYWFLTAHYRSPISFSWQALKSAARALEKLKDHLSAAPQKKGKPVKPYLEKFRQYIENDLDTPKALALTWELIKNPKIKEAQKISTVLEFDKVFGLKLNVRRKEIKIPLAIRELVKKREAARKKKDWKGADKLRELIKQKGFEIKDTDGGPILSLFVE
ncbi:MAG: cysteinyl-tRNA synthetase, partial [Parcubacteria group bacterium Gr01-1014_107]